VYCSTSTGDWITTISTKYNSIDSAGAQKAGAQKETLQEMLAMFVLWSCA